MKSSTPFLLAGTALLAVLATQPQALGATAERGPLLAQNDKKPESQPQAQKPEAQKPEAPKPEAQKPQAQQQPKEPPKPAAPQSQQPAAQQSQKPPAQAGQKASEPARPAPAQAEQKPAPSAKPDAKPAAAAQQQPPEPKSQARPAADGDRDRRDAGRGDERRDSRREDRRDRQAPAPAASKPADEPAKQAAPQQPAIDKEKAATSTAKPAEPEKPSAQSAPAAKPDDNARAAAAPPPPTKPRDAGEFILRRGETARGGMDDLRRSRRETREGDRVVIREGDRAIVREGNRTIIRHNEADRFAIGARTVDVQRRGDQTTTVVVRPNGVRIVTVTDRQGNLIRRVRRDPNGRDIVIIDNSFAGPRRDFFVDVRPPRMRDRGRYIIDAGRVPPAQIYEVFVAPPIERIERRYTLAEVRYSSPLREYMPRVDLDINFETGSWQLSPEQIDRLAEIAAGLNRAIDRNPREVFLIEGHTDKVGSDEDNLSLSDRRAEAVAVALTERFEVPSENLVTQGYGEEYPKVRTEDDARENRRVAVRRITPLIAQAESEGRR